MVFLIKTIILCTIFVIFCNNNCQAEKINILQFIKGSSTTLPINLQPRLYKLDVPSNLVIPETEIFAVNIKIRIHREIISFWTSVCSELFCFGINLREDKRHYIKWCFGPTKSNWICKGTTAIQWSDIANNEYHILTLLIQKDKLKLMFNCQVIMESSLQLIQKNYFNHGSQPITITGDISIHSNNAEANVALMIYTLHSSNSTIYLKEFCDATYNIMPIKINKAQTIIAPKNTTIILKELKGLPKEVNKGHQVLERNKGSHGEKGDKGDKGDKGVKGFKGVRGENGDKGDSAGIFSSTAVDVNLKETIKSILKEDDIKAILTEILNDILAGELENDNLLNAF